MLFAFASNPGPSTALPGYETVVSHLTTDVTELWRNRGNPAGSRNYAYPAQAAAFLRLWATPAQGGTRVQSSRVARTWAKCGATSAMPGERLEPDVARPTKVPAPDRAAARSRWPLSYEPLKRPPAHHAPGRMIPENKAQGPNALGL